MTTPAGETLTRRQALAALAGGALSNAGMIALALLLSGPTPWALLGFLAFGGGLAVVALVGRTVPTAFVKDTAVVARKARLPVVLTTAVYLLLEVGSVGAIGYGFATRLGLV